MKLILNEQELVDKALKEKYISKKTTDTIKALIKHYYITGMDDEQVRQSIESFMKESYNNYNSVKWKVKLDKLVRSLGEEKCVLNNINRIDITMNELNEINSIGDIKVEKIAFVALVHTKIYNLLNPTNDNWVNSSTNELFLDAKFTVKRKKKELIIGDLLDRGLVLEAKATSNANIKMNFIDKEDSEIAMSITDFRDFIYQYVKYKGGKVGTCQIDHCKVPILITSNRTKYCTECSKKIKNEQNASYKQQKREGGN